MTHYFLYIKAGVQLDAHTRFYKVLIGEGKNGVRQNAWLEAYAAEHGHMFVRLSLDARSFYAKCCMSIGVNVDIIETVTAKQLIETLKTGCEVPACFEAIHNRHKMMMQLDPHYYTYYELSKR